MINLNLIICNVFSDRFRPLNWYDGDTPWQHKHWEVQAMLTNNWLCVRFEWTARCDHAGVELELGMLGFNVLFRFYDDRHWDREKQCYCQ